jgi:multisubunit Na+/H+ antiporter MnhG subunit
MDKKVLTEILKSYNEDLELEKLHKNNMIRNFGACIIWIGLTALSLWFPEQISFHRILVTAYAVILITITVTSCLILHQRYKMKVKSILYCRQACLEIRDNIVE